MDLMKQLLRCSENRTGNVIHRYILGARQINPNATRMEWPVRIFISRILTRVGNDLEGFSELIGVLFHRYGGCGRAATCEGQSRGGNNA